MTGYSELEGTHSWKDQQSPSPELPRGDTSLWPWHPAGVEGSPLFPSHLPHYPRTVSVQAVYREGEDLLLPARLQALPRD